MDTKKYIEIFDELDNEDLADDRKPRTSGKHPKKISLAERLFVSKQDDSLGSFKFTYKAARFEEWWLLDSLGKFYEHKWISDVLRRVKGGKEASVYQCRAGDAVDSPLVAAKVYRPRSLRNLKNDQQYRTGRIELDSDGQRVKGERALKAIMQRTQYGEEVRHQSWISYEFQTLKTLYDAGADVPKPYAIEKNAILMGYIGDLNNAAPALHSVNLELAQAKSLFERVIHNLNILLANQRIHGDLSAYNILYFDGKISLIDFPQVVHPELNPQGWSIFQRDVTRVCDYFSAQGVQCDPRKLAADLWIAHGYKIGKDVDPQYLDAENPSDRYAWENQQKGK